MTTVGLFGYYQFGNFGDDLMAVMFAHHLQSMDVKTIIYGSAQVFTEQFGFQTVETVNELCEKSDLLVVGGGGILVKHAIPRAKFRRFDSDLATLLEQCRISRKPLAAISIGGGGLPLSAIESTVGRELLQTATFVTLRNQQEAGLLTDANCKGETHHDVVWSTPRMFTGNRPTNKRRRIGVNIYLSKSESKAIPSILDLLSYLPMLRRDCDVVYFDIHEETSALFRVLRPSWLVSGGEFRRFGKLKANLEFLRSLDLLVTSRLHVGVTALSYGIPVVSVASEPKVKLFFEGTGLSHLYYGEHQQFRLLQDLVIRPRFERLLGALDGVNLQPFIVDSLAHYQCLTDFIRIETSAGRETM
ncbi:MAG: hypothetical protein F6K14_17190 [Symploca sp. SIO2C1]|nr:hypothetical protein [Symploca sp. SIO2C1]